MYDLEFNQIHLFTSLKCTWGLSLIRVTERPDESDILRQFSRSPVPAGPTKQNILMGPEYGPEEDLFFVSHYLNGTKI